MGLARGLPQPCVGEQGAGGGDQPGHGTQVGGVRLLRGVEGLVVAGVAIEQRAVARRDRWEALFQELGVVGVVPQAARALLS